MRNQIFEFVYVSKDKKHRTILNVAASSVKEAEASAPQLMRDEHNIVCELQHVRHI